MSNFQPHFRPTDKHIPGSFLDWYGKKEAKKYCPNHPVKVIKPQFSVCYACWQKGEK